MALTGQLSDMSLAELIEFFCNQRKTGRLKVDYHRGHGVFFIKEGELMDAKVGQLSGSEAVYFALTLPNAAFDFSPEVQPTRRTISETWTQVVLEGLRQLDEGVSPTESDAFGGWTPNDSDMALFMDQVERLGENGSKAMKDAEKSSEAAPLSMMVEGAEAGSSNKKKFMLMGAAACVVLAVGVAAIPLMSGKGKPAAGAAPQAAVAQPDASSKSTSGDVASAPVQSDSAAADTSTADADAAAAREREERQREQRQRERKAEEAKKADAAQDSNAAAAAAPASGPKSVRVTVTYDEAGRVTATSIAGSSPGAENYAGAATKIARGKRFPAGKAGSTVVTIPVN